VLAAYDMLLKEKVDNTQVKSQVSDLQKQLDRSRKEYSRLLSRVDEDQEETDQLRIFVRE
jgi:CTP-dependent riboflavin kinase